MTALQVSRVASIALSYVIDDDVIFTSDADIWPMSTKFWNDYLSRSLNNDGDDFYVYDKRFFYEQRMKKDCNFLAVTIGLVQKLAYGVKSYPIGLTLLNMLHLLESHFVCTQQIIALQFFLGILEKIKMKI
jgi:phosphomevalonate kinase